MDWIKNICCCRACYEPRNYDVIRESYPLIETDYPRQISEFRIDVEGGHILADVGLDNDAYPYHHPSRGWLMVQPVKRNAPVTYPITVESSQPDGNGKSYSMTVSVGDGQHMTPVKVVVFIPNDAHDDVMKVMQN